MNVCDYNKQWKLRIDKWKSNHDNCKSNHRVIDLNDTQHSTRSLEYDKTKKEYTYDGVI